MSATTTPRGSVLLLVLVVVAVLALATQSYLELMQNERQAVRFHGRRAQATELAESGVEYLKYLMSLPTAELEQLGGVGDNGGLLKAAVVDDSDDPLVRGQFSVLAPRRIDEPGGRVRYGLENESSKLHVNALLMETDAAAARKRLMALPSMSMPIADAILDWLDGDDSPREFGAEASYYQGLPTPYEPANGPLASLDELLAVRGVTRALLFGPDANRNWQVDPSEISSNGPLPQDGGDFSPIESNEMDRGWSAYLTVHSSERPVTPDGGNRVNVNMQDMKTLHDDLRQVLDEDQASFIVLYRQYGASDANERGENTGRNEGTRDSQDAAVQIDYDKPGQSPIASLLDLVDATVEIPADEEKKTAAQKVASPWTGGAGASRDLLEVYDVATTASQERIAGRININLATRPVLRSIPNLTPAVAEQILARQDVDADDRRHAVWLWAEQLVELDDMKRLEPYVTGGGDAYRGQVAGFFAGGGPVARLEVCLDCTGGRPRLVERANWTPLGPGFLPQELGFDDEYENDERL